jgi:TolA-binding protein
MSKKITLSLLVSLLVIFINQTVFAQEKPVSRGEKAATEQVQPQPETVQVKYATNPVSRPKKTLEQEIQHLKNNIKALEALEHKNVYNEEKLVRLKKELAEKEQLLKKG